MASEYVPSMRHTKRRSTYVKLSVYTSKTFLIVSDDSRTNASKDYSRKLENPNMTGIEAVNSTLNPDSRIFTLLIRSVSSQ